MQKTTNLLYHISIKLFTLYHSSNEENRQTINFDNLHLTKHI